MGEPLASSLKEDVLRRLNVNIARTEDALAREGAVRVPPESLAKLLQTLKDSVIVITSQATERSGS